VNIRKTLNELLNVFLVPEFHTLKDKDDKEISGFFVNPIALLIWIVILQLIFAGLVTWLG